MFKHILLKRKMLEELNYIINDERENTNYKINFL